MGNSSSPRSPAISKSGNGTASIPSSQIRTFPGSFFCLLHSRRRRLCPRALTIPPKSGYNSQYDLQPARSGSLRITRRVLPRSRPGNVAPRNFASARSPWMSRCPQEVRFALCHSSIPTGPKASTMKCSSPMVSRARTIASCFNGLARCRWTTSTGVASSPI